MLFVFHTSVWEVKGQCCGAGMYVSAVIKWLQRGGYGNSDDSPIFTQPLSVISRLDTFRSLVRRLKRIMKRSGAPPPLHLCWRSSKWLSYTFNSSEQLCLSRISPDDTVRTHILQSHTDTVVTPSLCTVIHSRKTLHLSPSLPTGEDSLQISTTFIFQTLSQQFVHLESWKYILWKWNWLKSIFNFRHQWIHSLFKFRESFTVE